MMSQVNTVLSLRLRLSDDFVRFHSDVVSSALASNFNSVLLVTTRTKLGRRYVLQSGSKQFNLKGGKRRQRTNLMEATDVQQQSPGCDNLTSVGRRWIPAVCLEL